LTRKEERKEGGSGAEEIIDNRPKIAVQWEWDTGRERQPDNMSGGGGGGSGKADAAVRAKNEEAMALKSRLYVESRQKSKNMREAMREQKHRSRQLIVACARKMQEQEAEIEQLRSQHVGDLSAIAQELTFLQSNMVKEQKRLEEVIRSKDGVLVQQKGELENLKEQNKKLQMLTKAKLMLRDDGDKDMDTPSSEDSSPKASFSKGPKAEIKSRSKANETKSGCGIQTSAPVATLIAGETEQIRHDMRSMMQTRPDPPTPPPKCRPADPAAAPSPPAPAVLPRPARVAPIGACSPNSDGGNKPPVPSRAAVNKKLQEQQHQHQSPPPPPIPARSQAPKATRSPKEERIDSGRESDDFAAVNDSSFDESKMKKNFKEFLRDNMSSYATGATTTATGGGSSIVRRTPPFSASASVLSAGSNGDEGFSSSHEDQSSLSTPPLPPPPPPPPRTTSSSSSPEGDTHRGRQLTNHHRAVQKPRDIKYRSKLKSNSTSTLGVLEEHQVVSSVGGGGGGGCAVPDGTAVTTVTYWTEPYL